VVAQLRDNPSLVHVLGLRVIPHYTTLQKASRRLLFSRGAQRLLEATIRLRHPRRRRVKLAAIDSTGLECTSASAYFIRRRVRREMPWKTVVYHRFAKLTWVCDTREHFILAYRVGRGPWPDVDELRPLVAEALRTTGMQALLGDAGFDSEANHSFARQAHHIRTMIPARHGRPTTKPARGRYRRLMQIRFDAALYGQRAQVETMASMLKRRQGAYVHGRTYHSQCRDLRLMALTHNLMIVLRITVFYRASMSPFSPDSLYELRDTSVMLSGLLLSDSLARAEN
jgi:hypothetical protein